MARTARFMVPDVPHHVTQRGNRRQRLFYDDEDYALYLDLLRERLRKPDVELWTNCLMPTPGYGLGAFHAGSR